MVGKKEILEALETTNSDFHWMSSKLIDIVDVYKNNGYEQLANTMEVVRGRLYRIQLAIKSDLKRSYKKAKFNRDWKNAESKVGTLHLDFLNFKSHIVNKQRKGIQKIIANHNI